MDEAKDISESERMLQVWIGTIRKSETDNTNGLYRTVMRKYCELTQMSIEGLVLEAEKESTLLLRKQSINKHILSLKEFLMTLSPTSRATYMAVVASFYSFYDIPIPKKLFKRESKPSIMVENDCKLEDKDIGNAFRGCTLMLPKIIIAIQYTSGLAMSDVLKLKVKDVIENVKEDGVACITIKRQKTGVDFHTFLSPTATRMAQEYIQELKLEPENRLVCEIKGIEMNENHYMYLFRKIAEEMEKNADRKLIVEKEKWIYNKFHSHNLRKMFFNTLLKVGGFEMSTLAEYFMGHKIPDTRAAYFKADKDALRKEYMKIVPYFEKVLNGIVTE